ncbi:MAG: HlyD family efflux transporter periplasmic adaptor subunit, partial [Planctomycetaceae bacterium]|nr:HlyD family efflux transporter periplasmic adaptor subunit [Planctomycetaceae bacterium]
MSTDGRSAAADGMVASNERPIPLMRRADLKIARIDYLGVGYQVIKDPVALKYHRLQVEQYRILELLNGERSLEQVRDDLKKEFPTLQVTLGDIQQLITDLHKKGLVISNRPGQGAAVVRERRRARNEKIKQTLMSLLYLRLPGWDPEKTLRWMYSLAPIRAIFHPTVVTLCLLFVVSSWLVLGANLEEFHRRLPGFQSFFGWPNLIYLWVTLGVAKIIHEFGHGLSCHHFGGECHEMGIMLLVFSPCLYCDVTDSWMMKNKWHRIIIGAAGMYIEVILSAAAIYVWWLTKPGLLNYLALNTFFVTTITTVIFNANPLMRFDGYYMMSDFLEIPNLRNKSDKLLRDAFSWYCLGIESRPDPFMPETGRAWFVLYAIAAWCYRWVILVSISLFLYTVLKPYDLQSIGIMLMFSSMAGIVFSMIRNTWQIISAPRIEPMSKPKIAVSLALVAAVGWIAFSVQIPWHHEAPLYLEPKGVKVVTADLTGRIVPPQEYEQQYNDLLALQEYIQENTWEFGQEIHAKQISLLEGMPTPAEYRQLPQNGDVVTEGQVLAVLEDQADIDARDQIRRLAAAWLARTNEARRYHEQLLLMDRAETIAELTALQEQIRALVRRRVTGHVVRAPITGTSVAAPRIPEQERDELDAVRLAHWHGTPFDSRNTGCVVEAGQELMSIAPDDQLQAILFVEQGDRDDLKDDTEIEMKIDHLPDVTYVSRINGRISAIGDLVAPESL